MENLGEIVKSCLNYKDMTSHSTDCFGCVERGNHINWKPLGKFQPIPMQEVKVEEYEIKSQADGLVQLMSKVDLDNPEHPANQELLPELTVFNNLKIFKQIQNKSHLCHYTKFQLDFDINASIRFIHAFDDRPELVGKFIFKHHEDKLFSIIEPQLAEHFIKTQCSSEAEEFINRYVGGGKGKKYRRIKVTENSLTKFFES